MNLELTQEQRQLQARARQIAQQLLLPKAAQLDEEERFDRDLFRQLGEAGFLGMMIPKTYGGTQHSVLDNVIVGEEFAATCAGTTLSFGAHAVLCAHNLARNGTEDQKRKYLPKLATGEWIGALAMTEPQAGSDVLSMRTEARRIGDRYLLNGRKTYITNGAVADLILVYARTSKELGPHGISAFLIETRWPGFKVEYSFKKMGMRASPTAQIAFENMEIPAENLLGEENGGLAILMSGLDVERATGGALGVGIARAALERSIHHTRRRKQFGKPIIQHQMIGQKLADMAMEVEAARWLTYAAAAKCDRGERATLEASMAKLYAAEVAERAALTAIQIHGGHGYMRPTGVERFLRDAKLLTIGGGTSEIQRFIIIKHLTGEWGSFPMATSPELYASAEPDIYERSLQQDD